MARSYIATSLGSSRPSELRCAQRNGSAVRDAERFIIFVVIKVVLQVTAVHPPRESAFEKDNCEEYQPHVSETPSIP